MLAGGSDTIRCAHQEYLDNGVKMNYKEAETEDGVAIGRDSEKSLEGKMLHFGGCGCGNEQEGRE